VWEQQPPPTNRFITRGSGLSARQAERSGKRGTWGLQPPPAKRLVARESEPSARQAERSVKRRCGDGSPRLPSASFPAVASRLQGNSKILKAGYAAVTIRESASARRLTERQQTAPQA
jgi:hypothetical protein